MLKRNDKLNLMEATKLALQGKLTESVLDELSPAVRKLGKLVSVIKDIDVRETMVERLPDGALHIMTTDKQDLCTVRGDYFSEGEMEDLRLDGFIYESDLEESLTESIEWKKDIHDKNFDYHNDEDGNYRRYDYEDEVYDFGTFYVDNQKFTVTHTINSHRASQFNNTYNISSVHPYDNAEYHYASAKEGASAYRICKDGKFIEELEVSDVSSDSEIEKVAQRLLELDEGTEARIDRS